MKKQTMLTLAISMAVLGTSCGGNVTVVVPKEFTKLLEIGDYDLGDQENGYREKTQNEDGSITYVFTKSQHKQLLVKLSASIEDSVKDLDN